MRLKRGKTEYRTPKIGLFDSAALSDTRLRCLINLLRIRWNEMMKLELKYPKPLATPAYFYICEAERKLIVYPAPDKNYNLKLRFYPPMVEK